MFMSRFSSPGFSSAASLNSEITGAGLGDSRREGGDGDGGGARGGLDTDPVVCALGRRSDVGDDTTVL